MNDKICIVSTVRAPKQQILDFVNYHLNIGVDHIFLFFDGPINDAINLLKKNRKISCYKCNQKHYSKLGLKKDFWIEQRQKANANFGMRQAKKKKFNWIIHIDIDELIYIKEEIKSFLEKISKEVDFIRLPSLESVPEKLDYKNSFKEVSLFKNNFWKISKLFFKAHIAGKSIVRISSKKISLGIHTPFSEQKLKYKISYLKGRVLHFHCYDFMDWKRKWFWRTDGTGEAKEGDKRLVAMEKDFKMNVKNKKEQEMIEYYKKNFFIPKWKKHIYKAVRIIIRIKLNEKLFEKND